MLKNNPTSPGNETSIFVMVSTQLNGFQRIRKTSGFPRFFKHIGFETHIIFNKQFSQVQKQTGIPIDLHKHFRKFFISENIGFSGGFQTIQTLDFKHYL